MRFLFLLSDLLLHCSVYFTNHTFCPILNLCVAGFGEQYIWFGLEEGLEAAKNSNKPLMLIIHKTWCGACKGSVYFNKIK